MFSKKREFKQALILAAWVVSGALLAGCASRQKAMTPSSPTSPVPHSMPYHEVLVRSLVAPVEEAGGTVGAVLLDMNGQPLAAYDPDRLMTPASVQKLALAADACLSLPEQYRWTTTLLTDGSVDDGVLTGDLYLVGGYDPTLSGPRPYSDWPFRRFDKAAKRFCRQGIERIDGDIVGVGDTFVPGVWEVGDLVARYAPVVSQLTWNDGLLTTWAGMLDSVEIRGLWPDSAVWTYAHAAHWAGGLEQPPAWSWADDSLKAYYKRKADPVTARLNEIDQISVPDPRWLAVDAFRQSLRRAGIMGGDSTRVTALSCADTASLKRLMELKSLSRDSVLSAMLARSSNGWAELVGATINTENRRGRPGEPTWPAALDSLGVRQRGLRATDACGLARSNVITASTIAELLIAAYDRWGVGWVDLLPRPQMPHSTLVERMAGLEPYLVVKTGALSRVRSLAGYVLANGEPVAAFAILVNHADIDLEERLDGFMYVLVKSLGVASVDSEREL
jgi:D-alanyl-D-alanine carboxypeptidase/D-alanyl-D-alanine-endopeptidase (penicillin-binding protein 4)